MATAISDDALQGTLHDFPLASLLRMLAEKRATGRLSIAGESDLWLSAGRIYLATTPAGSPVAAVLYGADVGTRAEIDRLLSAPSVGGTVEAGAIDMLLADKPQAEPVLRRLLHEHNLNSLFELLVPSDRQFSFEPGPMHPIGDHFANDTTTLVAQAEHRVEVWRRIAARIPSTGAVFRLVDALPDGNFERLVTADEWKYLACLDGTTNVAEVIAATGESAFRACSTLYRLLLEGLIIEAT